MTTLLVDGDNLLTIGFYGVKNYYHKGKHFGGLYHFINTLRKSFENFHLDKIVVFWDGEESSTQRRKFYHQYKVDRKTRVRSEEEKTSYKEQRIRIQQYLEELYVRQGEFDFCETDDCVAYYVQNSPNEEIIIYSSDGDLTQLISEKVKLYNPSHRKLYTTNDLFVYEKQEILIENVKIAKMLCGDKSDSISGIKNLGIKTLIKYIPEIKTDEITLGYVKEKFNILFENDKHNKLIANVLTGVTREGVFGDEFYDVIEKLVNLDNPYLTDIAKETIQELVIGDIDPEGRSYKNTMRMMMEDGMFTVLPKSDDGWVQFLNPFLRLTRKEKNKRTIKIKRNE
jgi:5'-3' exonuclease